MRGSLGLKTWINVRQPLRRVIKLRREDLTKIMAIIRYEQLPIFCYECGIMGQMERSCTHNGNDRAKGYGFWLITGSIPSRCIWQEVHDEDVEKSSLRMEVDESVEVQHNHEVVMKRREFGLEKLTLGPIYQIRCGRKGIQKILQQALDRKRRR